MQHAPAARARVLQDRAGREDVAGERHLVGEHEIHVVRDRGERARAPCRRSRRRSARAASASARPSRSTASRAVPHSPPRTSPSAPPPACAAEGAEPALAQAARVEHPARLVDQADDAHGRAAVARQRLIWLTSSRPTRPKPSRMMSVPLRAAPDLAAADLVQVEGAVHGLAARRAPVHRRRRTRRCAPTRPARWRRRSTSAPATAPKIRAAMPGVCTMPEPTTAIVASPVMQLDVVDLATLDLRRRTPRAVRRRRAPLRSPAR